MYFSTCIMSRFKSIYKQVHVTTNTQQKNFCKILPRSCKDLVRSYKAFQNHA